MRRFAILTFTVAVAGLAGLLVGDLKSLNVGLALLCLAAVAIVCLVALRWYERGEDARICVILVVSLLMHIAGAYLRYRVLVDVYDFSGDAGLYHRQGVEEKVFWESLSVPPFERGIDGTEFMNMIVSLVYAIYTPTIFGGFLLFTMLSFIGYVFFYKAYVEALPDAPRMVFALALFLAPSLLYWPSSIGKESVMLLSLGIAAYGAARVLRRYDGVGLFFVAAGMAIPFFLRAHVAGMFGAGFAFALLFSRAATSRGRQAIRTIMVVIGLAGAVGLIVVAGANYNVSSAEDLEDVAERTDSGGSTFTPPAVGSPADIPWATVTVLARPFPWEAGSSQELLASLENTLLLGVMAWRLPITIRFLKRARDYPYLLLCLAYTGAFIVGFSFFSNFGILTRERTQVLPFVYTVFCAAPWNKFQKQALRDEQKAAKEREKELAFAR